MKIDPSILRALSLDASTSTLSSHGGSGFTSTYRISSSSNKQYFLKTSPGSSSKTMFAGEHHSLNAIHAAVPTLCPESLAWGKLDNASEETYYLVTDFLDLRSRNPAGGTGKSLAQKLAQLHTTPAPIAEGHSTPQFGFPVPTCCGDTPQTNTYTSSWASFYAENRLLGILQRAERNNGLDKSLRRVVERTATEVVPYLLGDGHLGGTKGITPVVVHGDLWSGNHGCGTLSSSSSTTSGVEEVIFDPSSCYAHSEYELGIMRMFGGFGASFLKEYHKLVPKTEPVEEYDDRISLYEAYHHLNHYAIFGGGYKGGAMRLLEGLIKKYAKARKGREEL